MKITPNWKYRTVEELDGRSYGEPSKEYTGLVNRCLSLCKKPVGQYTTEDLRVMISQSFSLKYLVRQAIEVLQDDVLAEGDLYRGDLMEAVLKVSNNFWESNIDLWTEVNALYKANKKAIDDHCSTHRSNFGNFEWGMSVIHAV
jgi:hypothetical protein